MIQNQVHVLGKVASALRPVPDMSSILFSGPRGSFSRDWLQIDEGSKLLCFWALFVFFSSGLVPGPDRAFLGWAR
jgi:hypothetical protein